MIDGYLWDIFKTSGNIDAYLLYKDFTNDKLGFDEDCRHLRTKVL